MRRDFSKVFKKLFKTFQKTRWSKKRSLFLFPLHTYNSTFIHEACNLTCSWVSSNTLYRNYLVGRNIQNVSRKKQSKCNRRTSIRTESSTSRGFKICLQEITVHTLNANTLLRDTIKSLLTRLHFHLRQST